MNLRVVVNFVLFQIGWFACVIGAAKQLPWLGVAVVLACVAWHLASAKNARAELILLLIALVIGGLFDQFMQTAGLITYHAHGWSSELVPVWILALWLAFSTTLNVSLRWMHERWLVAFLFGAIGGPFAYLGAAKIGAANLDRMPTSYLLLAIGWGVLTPILLKVSKKFDGFLT